MKSLACCETRKFTPQNYLLYGKTSSQNADYHDLFYYKLETVIGSRVIFSDPITYCAHLSFFLQLTPAAARTELYAWPTREGPTVDVWSCVWVENGYQSVWILISPLLLVGLIKMQELFAGSWATQMLKVHACINEMVNY